jgi:hypothetical protein
MDSAAPHLATTHISTFLSRKIISLLLRKQTGCWNVIRRYWNFETKKIETVHV